MERHPFRVAWASKPSAPVGCDSTSVAVIGSSRNAATPQIHRTSRTRSGQSLDWSTPQGGAKRALALVHSESARGAPQVSPAPMGTQKQNVQDSAQIQSTNPSSRKGVNVAPSLQGGIPACWGLGQRRALNTQTAANDDPRANTPAASTIAYSSHQNADAPAS